MKCKTNLLNEEWPDRDLNKLLQNHIRGRSWNWLSHSLDRTVSACKRAFNRLCTDGSAYPDEREYKHIFDPFHYDELKCINTIAQEFIRGRYELNDTAEEIAIFIKGPLDKIKVLFKQWDEAKIKASKIKHKPLIKLNKAKVKVKIKKDKINEISLPIPDGADIIIISFEREA